MSSAGKNILLVLLELEFYLLKGGIVITSVCAMDTDFSCYWTAFF
jgi:hypothetical protein